MSVNINFKKRETVSKRNEEIYAAEGVYVTSAGNAAAYSYSCTLSFFQGRAWVHLQDNRQGKQVSLMKEALEGLFRIYYKIEDGIKKVEETGKGDVPPIPSLFHTQRRHVEEEEEEELPNLRITPPRKRKVQLIKDDDDIDVL